MKRIVASVGLVALGTSALQAVNTSGLSAAQTTKPWSVSASLRGFYDDNINTTKRNKEDSVGFQISPTVSFGVAGESTSFNASYTYSGKYFEEKLGGRSDHWDHTHIFGVGLHQVITPRIRASLRDSFVIGQEPDVLRLDNTAFSTFQRISGDNYRNYGAANVEFDVTRLLSIEVGYDNAWYDYDDRGEGGLPGRPSNSASLDRIEHGVHIDSRWHVAPQTVGIFGYKYGWTDYTSNERIALAGFGSPIDLDADDRNSRSHYFYGGLEHSFNPALSGSLRVGAQYKDFYKDAADKSDWSPYVQGSLRYAYAVESSVEMGVTHSQVATDLVGPTFGGSFVRDIAATTAYGSVTHRILPKLFATLVGTFQYSTFNGGEFDDENEKIYLVGLDLAYRFNQHFSAHTGYNYDRLDSDIGRDFSRNRVYAGVTATY
ncbi:MAG: outer membrane beta-barrel protein [Verrucomicrobia bacterium]|nr:outer membrane beta-barrel protein [Verrucomicrobiota bacterium]